MSIMRLTAFPISESPVNLMIGGDSGDERRGPGDESGWVGRGRPSRDDTHTADTDSLFVQGVC